MMLSAFFFLSLLGKFVIDRLKQMKCSVNRSPVPDEDVTVASEKEELTLGEIINIKLVESGEKDNPMELVRDRLVESGWKDEMRVACRKWVWLKAVFRFFEHVKKKGRKDVTVDELIRVITPKGRASVPDAVKQELLNRIQNSLDHLLLDGLVSIVRWFLASSCSQHLTGEEL
ncbi:hypothetical protein DY000_02025398 [Brassica cretica]|uniref:Transcription and mRNA export factor ENY2 n=1 Tax=Brassica cretica TaxID=69181 RepID=A0ABQ7E601_BRACR|nr:hypothetical protein DY000_02025398 [Brassica cretica]